MQYQILQRNAANEADIAIAGTLPEGIWDVEARYAGGSWATIATASSLTFTGTLAAQPTGEALLEVRRKVIGSAAAIARVPNLSIGEVFVCAGQSNCSGYLENNQVFTGAGVCRMLGNDYVWKECFDPTDFQNLQVDVVSRDTSFSGARGSVWPLVLTHISDTLGGVPVGFIPSGLGGSSIVAWQPGVDHFDRTTLFGSMLYRARISGVRAVLWWQGESDARDGMSAAAYQAYLEAIANVIGAELGTGMIVVHLQNNTAVEDALETEIRTAVTSAAAVNTNILAVGPDLSDIDTEDGFHVVSDALAATVAQRWADTIEAEFGW